MQDGIVIGEGVVLDARPASFITRAMGAMLDFIVLGVVIGIAAGVGGLWFLETASVSEDAALIIWAVASAVVVVGVPVTVETLSRGRSVGKLACGIRVVRDDGGPVRFRHALVRALIGIFELWLTFGGIAAVVSLANAKGKRLGDLAAGTYAVRVRGGRPPSAPVVMPQSLAAWAHTADMRRLPDGLALAARQLLGRAARLAPESRAQLADDLAGRIEPYVAPGPPPGTHPEAFLHAVLAERRERELEAGRRDRRRAQEQAELLHRLPFAVADPPR
ncbi:RDD family protein [Promicromonospora thailandica]|uniref:Membrane protein YckC, RDD family n=1 Tax=Promicromonospora thailandica TaxID=765201 RepID=A0A9X2G2Z9_9MICO|nr:RDD family protein [Promicromonospora thailandica]MCP2266140.1 putative membrane protein YckC, RDD family [Promicromonospora thailandica]BFF20612.1 RDD family protein [Promicromonospora thailandica]